MLSSISCEKAAGSSLNFALQLRSRHSRAFRTLSGSSSLVVAARVRICLASVISVSGLAATVDLRDDDEYGLVDRVGRLARGTLVKATAYCASARRIKKRFIAVVE